MASAYDVSSLYKTVVDDVISNVKESFLDEGVDEQVLVELRQLWESKLTASKAMDPAPTPKIQLTAPSMGLLFQGQTAQQSGQQPAGYIPRGAVLTTTVQQQPQAVLAPAQRDLTGAAAQATMALPVSLFQQQLAALGAAGQGGLTLQATGNGQYIAVQNIGGQATTFAIPQQAIIAGSQPQQVIQPQPVATVTQGAPNTSQPGIVQIDGTGDGSSSSDDDDFDNDDNDDDNDDEQNDDDAEEGEEEEPLNSDDDVSEEEDPTELFDADSVIVCQYDKINRIKNKWKFQLKDGIMNLNGRDFVFQRATGDAEW